MSKFLPEEYKIIAEQGFFESLFDNKMKTRTEQNFVRYYEAKNKCIMTDRNVISKDESSALVQYEFSFADATTQNFQIRFSTNTEHIANVYNWLDDNSGWVFFIIICIIIWFFA